MCIFPPGDGDCISDIVFVVDSSGSIGMSNWPASLQFVIDVMKGLKIEPTRTRLSVVTYSTEVEVNFGLKKYTSIADIEAAVFGIEYMAGVTNTADGIKKMHEIMKEEGRGIDVATPIAIIVTDGMSNVDKTRTPLEAQSAKDDRIQMFTIGM